MKYVTLQLIDISLKKQKYYSLKQKKMLMKYTKRIRDLLLSTLAKKEKTSNTGLKSLKLEKTQSRDLLWVFCIIEP